ncbi:Protein transport protein yif1 [Conglomerata obtusa]
MDSEIRRSVVNAGKDYVHKGLNAVNTKALHRYFEINNTIVLQKLFLIIFPFNKDWTHGHRTSKPDLYIPLMSFLTYILLTGIQLKPFSPETLSMIFTRCLLYEILFVTIVKLTAYFMDVGEIRFLDFICYSGYKFVVILIKNCVKVRFLSILWSFYLYAAFFFFLSRSLKGVVVGEGGLRRGKIYFLFVTVFLEVFLVFLLG